MGSRRRAPVRRPTVEDCDDPNTPEQETIYSWNDRVGTVYAEPGVQVYEDPDPEGSPLEPVPDPERLRRHVRRGRRRRARSTAPASPVTNTAGQIDLRSGCE